MRRFFVVVYLAGLFLSASIGCTKTKGEQMTIENGSKVSFDYTLKVDNEVVDSSDGKQPLQYTHGQQEIIPGLEKELKGMQVGEEKAVVVSAEEGYGQIDPKAFRDIPNDSLPKDLVPKIGMMLSLKGAQGQAFPVRIAEVKESSIVIDLNHPLAGKALNFAVKVISIQ